MIVSLLPLLDEEDDSVIGGVIGTALDDFVATGALVIGVGTNIGSSLIIYWLLGAIPSSIQCCW